jgi:plasmid stabilization system protein ParE
MKYVLITSDQAEMDRDRLYLSRLRQDPDYAKRWDDGLTAALDNLLGFPGPLSHAKDEAASALFGREVRRLLYYGPTRRRTGVPSRILFTLLPPAEGEPPETAETAILLLRLLHGTQALLPDDPEEDAQP